MPVCTKCGAKLSSDEIGLYKKLVNRGAREFMCKPCLGAYMRIPVALLDEKIEQFRAMGCMLFAPLPDNKKK